MSEPVRMGFTADRQKVLAAIYLMGTRCCAYSGDTWADRCDCKYGIGKRGWPYAGEEGNGCPELRSLYGVIQCMTDEEWTLLTRRGGGTPSFGALLAGAGDLASRLHAADAAAHMAADNIAKVREALGNGTQ